MTVFVLKCMNMFTLGCKGRTTHASHVYDASSLEGLTQQGWMTWWDNGAEDEGWWKIVIVMSYQCLERAARCLCRTDFRRNRLPCGGNLWNQLVREVSPCGLLDICITDMVYELYILSSIHSPVVKDFKAIEESANESVASGLAVTHSIHAVTRTLRWSLREKKKNSVHNALADVYLQKWRYLGGSPEWEAEGWASAPLYWRPQRWSGRKYLSSKSWMKKKKNTKGSE